MPKRHAWWKLVTEAGALHNELLREVENCENRVVKTTLIAGCVRAWETRQLIVVALHQDKGE